MSEKSHETTSYRQVDAASDNQRLTDPRVQRVRIERYEDDGEKTLVFGVVAGTGRQVAFHLAPSEYTTKMRELLDAGERVEADMPVTPPADLS